MDKDKLKAVVSLMDKLDASFVRFMRATVPDEEKELYNNLTDKELILYETCRSRK